MIWPATLIVSTVQAMATALTQRWATPRFSPEGLAPIPWAAPRWATTHSLSEASFLGTPAVLPPVPDTRKGKRRSSGPATVSTTAPWVIVRPPGVQEEAPVQPSIRHPSLASRIRKLGSLTPQEIDTRLQAAGYRGQPEARLVASVIAHRHLRRLRRMWVDRVPASELPPRDNLLLVGPTGCGKTHLVETLFREVLQVPTIVVDITQFSETGYSGDDLPEIPGRLLEAAGGDLAWARCGVICLDEFDKLAGDKSSGKDVSGYGVQRGLLTLLASNLTQAWIPGTNGRHQRTMSLASVTFIGCGAFSGLEASHAAKRGVGFGAGQASALGEQLDVAQQTATLERYGFLPELIGRFTRTVTLSALGLPELRGIAEGLHSAYARDLASDGLDLTLGPEELDAVARRALLRGTGARGLRAEMQKRIEDLQYHRIGTNDEGKAR